MNKNRSRTQSEISTGSMADIAFLLLIFFLVTTTIVSDKGLMMQLPPKLDRPPEEIHQRNIFKILMNSSDEVMVENELMKDFSKLREKVKLFVLNPHNNNDLAISPKKAVVSIKAHRGTSYKLYVTILDEIQGAYYEIYADRAGISTDDFRKLDKKDARQRALYEKSREGIPMNISIAQPSK